MSPASRSKPKDKKSGKEPPKGSSKSSASGYNPLLGTFTTFETAPLPSVSPLHVNGRFRTIDDTADDHNGNNSSGTGNDYDSVSNNGSWSGESEDHKEKASPTLHRPESVPGSDNDKREKIRQKNERKHQRQKERRAQELHERCSGYLMSRKLEALAQQLVSMGFTQERATMALILNEGRVEESVSWLFESVEDENRQTENHKLGGSGGGNLKIDISEELARITEMEVRYKSSKQEVERAVVSCEGDLDKAEETLKAQKEEPPAVFVDPPNVGNTSKIPIPANQNPVRIQAKSNPSTSIQQNRDERDFNYTKAPITIGSSIDPGAKNMQLLKKIPPKSDWTKPQPQISTPAEKRVAGAGSNRSLTSPSPAKTEAHYVSVGNELKNLQLGSVKEPVMMMQRPPQYAFVKQQQQSPSGSLSSSPPLPPGTTSMMGWYPNSSVEMVKPSNGFVPPVAVSRSFSGNGVNSNPLHNHQFQYQQLQQQHQYMSNSSSSSPTDSLGTTGGRRGGASPPITAAASLGLFSAYSNNSTSGSSGSSPRVDWTTGNSTSPQFDYTTVDWSLDLGRESSPLTSRSNKGWGGSSHTPMQNDARIYDSYAYGLSVKSGAMRPVLSSNGAAVATSAPPTVAGVASTTTEQTGTDSREWSSPFEEKDIFSLPRQFVSSPSL
ncbi:hypothetical protein ACP275_14G236600 [Erythranthe tilingii]